MGGDGTLERAAAIRARKEALGMPDAMLAREANLSRGVVDRAMHGRSVLPASLGAMEAALDRVEEEAGPPPEPEQTATVELLDGTRVTFTGSAAGVAEAAETFLRRMDDKNVPKGDTGSAAGA